MRILFVSQNDQCRGPIAKAMSERIASRDGVDGCVFDSAGLMANVGDHADPAAIAFMRHEKFFITQHRTKPLTAQLADSADLILCMTQEITTEVKRRFEGQFAAKAVLLNEGIGMGTNRMDIDVPSSESTPAYRRLYAALLAGLGRMVRMLADHDANPEAFGAKTMPKKFKPGAAGGDASAASIPPEQRQFIASQLFELIERSFEPATTATLHDMLTSKGQTVGISAIHEILRQDLHGYIRVDRDGVWHTNPGAATKRREAARQQSRQRAEEKAKETRAELLRNEEKSMTVELALSILGLRAGASFEDAKKRYRTLLSRYHPDKFHDDDEFRSMAEEKALRINRAWEFLEGTMGD